MFSGRRSKRGKREGWKVRPEDSSSKRRAAAWIKNCGAVVVFVGTCLGVVAGIRQLMPIPCDTRIDPDLLLSIVRIDEKEFEFELPLTLMNTGGKPDRIDRPCVALTSDKQIVQLAGRRTPAGCLTEVLFVDKQGAVTFPIYLLKDNPRQLSCVIKWTPSEDYEEWNSEAMFKTQPTATTPTARIEINWKERNPIRFPFGLLAAETLRELKRDVPRQIHALDYGEFEAADGDEGRRSDIYSSSVPGPHGGSPAYRAIGIAFGSLASLGSTAVEASVMQQPKTHNAAPGEIASGKEVPSAKADEMIVNIRPCGGAEDLVVFRAQFRKRTLGLSPCGVRMVQVEKL